MIQLIIQKFFNIFLYVKKYISLSLINGEFNLNFIFSFIFLIYLFITLIFTYFLLKRNNRITYYKYNSTIKNKVYLIFKNNIFKIYYTLITIIFSKIFYLISILGFSTINKLNCLIRIFGILKFGILIYGILKNIFSLDVWYFPSESSLNFDNPNSEPTEPTGATEPTNTGPVEPIEFTEPTGATERAIYLANRPHQERVNWILADIKDDNPNYYNWLNKNPILQSKEVNYYFFKWQGEYAALKAGHISNSPGFNEYIERYTAYYMDLSEKYGYYNYTGTSGFKNL